MNGILAVNHFLKGEKYDILHKHLSASAKKCGINLNIKTVFRIAANIRPAPTQSKSIAG